MPFAEIQSACVCQEWFGLYFNKLINKPLEAGSFDVRFISFFAYMNFYRGKVGWLEAFSEARFLEKPRRLGGDDFFPVFNSRLDKIYFWNH
jgi:hypothetical protein